MKLTRFPKTEHLKFKQGGTYNGKICVEISYKGNGTTVGIAIYSQARCSYIFSSAHGIHIVLTAEQLHEITNVVRYLNRNYAKSDTQNTIPKNPS